MRVMGRLSLASFLKLVVDVPYYVLLVVVPAFCGVVVWLALTSGPGRELSLSLQLPVRFQLDPAAHPLEAAPAGTRAAKIAVANGELRIQGVPDGAVRWAGFVLAANQPMLGLARRLGFTVTRDPDDPAVRICRLLLGSR